MSNRVILGTIYRRRILDVTYVSTLNSKTFHELFFFPFLLWERGRISHVDEREFYNRPGNDHNEMEIYLGLLAVPKSSNYPFSSWYLRFICLLKVYRHRLAISANPRHLLLRASFTSSILS
jgi:hypothetical protein